MNEAQVGHVGSCHVGRYVPQGFGHRLPALVDDGSSQLAQRVEFLLHGLTHVTALIAHDEPAIATARRCGEAFAVETDELQQRLLVEVVEVEPCRHLRMLMGEETRHNVVFTIII